MDKGVAMNWTTAAQQYENLARISNKSELCEAQTFLRSDADYWTALKRVDNGTYHWGLNVSHLVDNLDFFLANLDELIDTTELGNCYVISKSGIQLKSKDCNSVLQRALIFHVDYGTG